MWDKWLLARQHRPGVIVESFLGDRITNSVLSHCPANGPGTSQTLRLAWQDITKDMFNSRTEGDMINFEKGSLVKTERSDLSTDMPFWAWAYASRSGDPSPHYAHER